MDWIETILGIIVLIGFVALLCFVAKVTGDLTDPIIDRADRAITRWATRTPRRPDPESSGPAAGSEPSERRRG